MIILKYDVQDYVMEKYSEQYKTDPLFHMAIDKFLYSGGRYLDCGALIGIISELCKFKYDETQFCVNMEFVENLLSGYLKDYDKKQNL